MSDGKEAALDRPGRVFRDAVEGVGLENVDAGVDSVAGDLVRARLLQKPPDVAVRIGLDQPVGRGIFDRGQDDGRLGLPLAVQPEDRRQIDGGQHVAVEHDHRFVEGFARIADRARRSRAARARPRIES